MPKITVNPLWSGDSVNIANKGDDAELLSKGEVAEVTEKRFKELRQIERQGVPVVVKYDPPKSAGADDAEGDS